MPSRSESARSEPVDIPQPGPVAAWWHLVTRFVGALWPGAPAATDVDWVRTILEPSEFALWSRQVAHDRRHTIGVARRVARELAPTPFAGDTRWVAAALLHDIGKVQSRLSVFGRVVATLAGKATGKRRVAQWSEGRGVTRRVGQYLAHGPIGADLIRVAGGRDDVAAWAAIHHDRSAWADAPIPGAVVRALVVSDQD